MSDLSIMGNTFKDVKGFILDDSSGRNVSFVDKPKGSINITDAGTYDVSKYANAVVNVQGLSFVLGYRIAHVSITNESGEDARIIVPNLDPLDASAAIPYFEIGAGVTAIANVILSDSEYNDSRFANMTIYLDHNSADFYFRDYYVESQTQSSLRYVTPVEARIYGDCSVTICIGGDLETV